MTAGLACPSAIPEVRLRVHSDPVTPRGRGSRWGAGSGPLIKQGGRGREPIARGEPPRPGRAAGGFAAGRVPLRRCFERGLYWRQITGRPGCEGIPAHAWRSASPASPAGAVSAGIGSACCPPACGNRIGWC